MTDDIVDLNKILEVTTIKDVQSHIAAIKTTVLVAIDIDETTLKSAQFFGSSCWSYAYLDKQQKKHNCHKIAFAKTMEKYIYAQIHTQSHPVEGDITKEFINNLHELDHKIVYVTARGHVMAEVTEKQLTNNNIKFNHTPEFKNKLVDLTEHVIESHATNGIIYAHGGDKGLCLEKYLEVVGCIESFTHIIAIDDKIAHLQELSQAARRLGKNFTGFRYGALDHTLQDFNLEVAKVQYVEHISSSGTKKFISDAEAQSRLKG